MKIMSSKTVIEQIRGELLQHDKTVYMPELVLTVKEMYANETSSPVNRALARVALGRMSGLSVTDGEYRLRYTFDGRLEEHSVRVQNGVLLSGVAA